VGVVVIRGFRGRWAVRQTFETNLICVFK